MTEPQVQEVVPAEAPVSLNISIDRSKVTLGDMRFMIRMRSQKEKGEGALEDTERLFDFLDRVVIGGIEHIPFDALAQVMEAVVSQINPESDIKN